MTRGQGSPDDLASPHGSPGGGVDLAGGLEVLVDLELVDDAGGLGVPFAGDADAPAPGRRISCAWRTLPTPSGTVAPAPAPAGAPAGTATRGRCAGRWRACRCPGRSAPRRARW